MFSIIGDSLQENDGHDRIWRRHFALSRFSEALRDFQVNKSRRISNLLESESRISIVLRGRNHSSKVG